MPRLFIIASHIVVIVIIMILYRFPLSAGVVAVLFHGPRLVWASGARRSHVQSRKMSVFLAETLALAEGMLARALTQAVTLQRVGQLTALTPTRVSAASVVVCVQCRKEA